MLTALLSLLLIVPVVTRYWSQRNLTTNSWALTGAAFGCVIAPASLGLYSTYYLGPVFFVTGLVGLALASFHGLPGYQMAPYLGLIEPGNVVSGIPHIPVEVANGFFWALVYGGIGVVLDRRGAPRPAL